MSGASSSPIPAARCVLWHPKGSPPPNDLIDAIQRRNLAWTATDRLLPAVVQTLSAPAVSLAPPPPVPTVLVLIDPPLLQHVGETLDVLSRYRPRTAFWVFDLMDPTRLKSMQPLEIVAKYVPHRSETPFNSPPRLHIVGEQSSPPPAPASITSQQGEPSSTNDQVPPTSSPIPRSVFFDFPRQTGIR